MSVRRTRGRIIDETAPHTEPGRERYAVVTDFAWLGLFDVGERLSVSYELDGAQARQLPCDAQRNACTDELHRRASGNAVTSSDQHHFATSRRVHPPTRCSAVKRNSTRRAKGADRWGMRCAARRGEEIRDERDRCCSFSRCLLLQHPLTHRASSTAHGASQGVRQIHERLLFFAWLGQASKQREARRLG
mgnify:CR=1 FL=1